MGESTLEIWHNPRCSKSRQTLDLLKKRGYEPKEILYLQNPPSEDRIREVLGILGITARDLMRTGEDEYKVKRLAGEKSEDALIREMHYTPKLIERPVVINGDRAVIGRPPENVLKIL